MAKRVILVIYLTTIFIPCCSWAQNIWVGKDGNVRNIDGRAIIADGGALYLATKNALYRGSYEKNDWEAIFSLPIGSNEINCLGGRPDKIFVGTKKGLFRSDDHGSAWKNIFRTIISEKSNVICVHVIQSGKIIIGTERGIFESSDFGLRWRDSSGILKDVAVKSVVASKGFVYAGTDKGLYCREDAGDGWERLLVAGVNSESGDVPNSDALEPEETSDPDGATRTIFIDEHRIYFGVDKKIFYSDDAGKNWKTYSSEGLAGFVTCILASGREGRLYCSTTRGVFEYSASKRRWSELYRGQSKNFNVKNMIFADQDEKTLWAVTDRGLYKFEEGKYSIDKYTDIENSLKTLKIKFEEEPSFKELQQAAMKFAEVNPEKIKNWRREARIKALLPKISWGLDKNRSTNSEIYTSASKDYVFVGPDDITNGWDVSVSWELGDLVWGDDQANIDVRSRLTTQLRNDILDDLRRVYFERKRLQFELETEPPRDLKARFEKEMRL